MALTAAIIDRWGPQGLTCVGIYNCRRVAGSSVWSVHAEGRAVDLRVVECGERVAAEVLDALLTMGDLTLQRIIYSRRIYDRDSGAGGRPFTGDPHVDHLHIELSWPAARGEIPLELALDVMEEDEMTPNLICAWRNAQWVVAADLSSKTGLPQPSDVTALLRVAEGRAYVATTLSDSLMARIPVVPLA